MPFLPSPRAGSTALALCLGAALAVSGTALHAWIMYAPLKVEPGHAARFFIRAAPGPDVTQGELPNDQVFVNPYTGEVVGERKWCDITQGLKNLMPFIYRLHYSLALGTVGSYAFGIVALLWTLDCFVGAYLTFPAGRRQRESSPHPRPFPASGRGEKEAGSPAGGRRGRCGSAAAATS